MNYNNLQTYNTPRQNDYSSLSSIMAEHQHHSVSDRYSFVPTKHVLGILEKNGWEVKDAREVAAQKHETKGFQKHIIRLRQTKDVGRMLEVNDIIPEIVMTNAHNGSAAFNLMAGLFRCWCSNQCVTSEATVASHRILHRGFTEEKILEAVYHIVEDTPKVIDNVNNFKAIELNNQENQLFGETALEILYGEEDKWKEYDLEGSARNLIKPRRTEDKNPNLWNSFNVVQEKFMQGGRFMVTKEEVDYYKGINLSTSYAKTKKTKKIKAIDKDVKLNRALWSLTERMAELKNQDSGYSHK